MSIQEDDGFFERLKSIDGLELETVFDVGSYRGNWSNRMHEYFPKADYHLFEPRYAFDADLLMRTQELWDGRENVSLNGVAVARDPGSTQFGVRGNDGVGSSLLIVEGNSETTVVDVETVRLDEYVKERDIDTVDFLKMDIQGTELTALEGAVEILKKCQFLFIETWTVRSYGGGTPLMYEMFDFVRDFGFVPFDFLGKHYSKKNIMSHVDVVYANPAVASLPKYLYRNLESALEKP